MCGEYSVEPMYLPLNKTPYKRKPRRYGEFKETGKWMLKRSSTFDEYSIWIEIRLFNEKYECPDSFMWVHEDDIIFLETVKFNMG